MALAALDYALDMLCITTGIIYLALHVPDIRPASYLMQATLLRVRRPELIASPTCGRLEIDLKAIVAEMEKRLAGRRTAVKVSILGCVVNGPGEAREADLGIAAGKGKGVICKRGEIIRHVLEHEMVDALIEEIDRWEEEEKARGTLPTEKSIDN